MKSPKIVDHALNQQLIDHFPSILIFVIGNLSPVYSALKVRLIDAKRFYETTNIPFDVKIRC